MQGRVLRLVLFLLMDKDNYQRMVTQLACANLMLEIETDLRGKGVLKRSLKRQMAQTSKLTERELGHTINTLYRANEEDFTKLQNAIETMAKDLASKSYHEIKNQNK